MRSCLVVGAGPAGAATALYLARAGCPVTVLEARRGLKNKLCGEGLMPAGVQVLSELGLLDTVLAAGARPFHGIRYRTPAGASARGTFPGAHGLAMPRVTLDAALRGALAAEPRITVREGWVVRDILRDGDRVRGALACERGGAFERFEADLTVGADGLSSRLHALPGVNARRPARRRFGLAAHLAGVAGLEDRVEVHLIHEGELYLTPEGPDAASLAMLIEESHFETGSAGARFTEPAALFARLLGASGELARRAAGARLVDQPRIYGPLGLEVTRACGPGWLLAGDAGGALDPITGEGVALAFVAARALGVSVRARGVPDEAACAAAVACRRRAERELHVLTHALLWLSRAPVVREGAVRMASAFPGLFSRVLGVAAGDRSG